MLLRKIKSRSSSYDHWLRSQDLPERLARPESEVLADLRRGAARDEAVLGHIRLAMQIAGRYIAKLNRSDKADALVSAAILGLAEGVQKVISGSMKHDNLVGYLVEQMHFAISKELEDERMFGAAARTRRWRRQNGIQKPDIKQETLTDEITTTNGETEIFEINEAIRSLNLSDSEREIVDLRVQGFRDDYIGNVVGLSSHSVCMIRKDLQTRYLGATK